MATEPQKTAGRNKPAVPNPPPGSDVWIMHAINGLQEDLKNRADQVNGRLDKLDSRLSRVEKVMWVATGGVAALVAVLGWIGLVFRPIIAAIAQRIMNG